MSLRSIVDALGGDLYEGGRRANIPAPGHSPRDRSVSLLLSEGRIVVHAFNGADWREVLDELRRRNLIDAHNAPRSLSGAAQTASPVTRPSDRDRIAAARRLWDGGRPISRTLSERYLRQRFITRDLPGETVLRHHPNAPISVYTPSNRAKPALLAAIRDAHGAFTAVEITYLDPNGRRAVGLRLSRKTVGLVPPGSAIRLDLPSPEMLVAEGLATTLSASERFALPGWALMSTRNLRSWSAPAGVRFVLVAGDRGEDGEASAKLLASRLRRQIARALICLPHEPHGDWSEAARRAGVPV